MSHKVPNLSHEVLNLSHQVEKVQCLTVIHESKQVFCPPVKMQFIEVDRSFDQLKNKINETMEMEGINYASTAGPGRRGGGRAITCNNNDFDMKEVVIDNPYKLEVTFAILRSKAEQSEVVKFVLHFKAKYYCL